MFSLSSTASNLAAIDGAVQPAPLGYRHALDHQTKSSLGNPSLKTNGEGKTVRQSFSPNPGTIPGEENSNDRATTHECTVLLVDHFRETSAKIIARKAGIGQRAAEAVKQGRQALSMPHLSNLCRSDPDFLVRYFAFCGGRLLVSPEVIAAILHAHREAMKMGAME